MSMKDLLAHLVDQAIEQGATDAEAIGVESVATSVRVRLGDVELVEQARHKGIGLRVFSGERSAVASTSDLSKPSLDVLVPATLLRAKKSAPVPLAGLPERDLFEEEPHDVDIVDNREGKIAVDEAIDLCTRAEATALDVDKRLTNSEGAEFSAGSTAFSFANSRNCRRDYTSSSYGFHAVPIAEANGEKVRDYASTARRHFEDLLAPEEVGRKAGEKTIRRLDAQSAPTGKVPVVFNPRMAGRIMGHVSGALNGYSLIKGTSFLLEKLGEQIASSCLTLVDDGTLARGLGTRPFDGEGLSSKQIVLLDEGRLNSYLLDAYTGRKLGMNSTRNAARSIGDAPVVSSTNLLVKPGTDAPEDIIRSVQRGLYITELFGFGVNTTTGDFSQGAAGMWIEGGELTHSVHEITIAGNLVDMLSQIEVVGNDLFIESAIRAPTIKISSMMVAGN